MQMTLWKSNALPLSAYLEDDAMVQHKKTQVAIPTTWSWSTSCVTHDLEVLDQIWFKVLLPRQLVKV